MLPATSPSAPRDSRGSADARNAEAGISLLEVMVGLAILALVMTVATASLVGRPFTGQTDQQAFVDFVVSLQRQAEQAGKAYALRVSPGHAEAGDQKLDWDTTRFAIRSSRDSNMTISVVLFPDGTALGPDLVIVKSGKETRLGLVERYDP